MNKGLKWMLLGIFLAVLSVWCLLAGAGDTVFAVASVILPIVAIVCFATGFSFEREPKGENPRDKEQEL